MLLVSSNKTDGHRSAVFWLNKGRTNQLIYALSLPLINPELNVLWDAPAANEHFTELPSISRRPFSALAPTASAAEGLWSELRC